ncbi:MAG: PAS domain-containing sensor histidine kinase [Candidatus Helarchaeota archaeon]
MDEKGLLESEEIFRIISEQNLMGIVILQDEKIIYANQKLANIIGYKLEELLSWEPKKYHYYIHPEDRDFVLEQARKKQRGDKDVIAYYKCRLLKNTGETVWVEIYSKPINLGGRPADFATINDITERHKSKQKLKESEAKNIEEQVNREKKLKESEEKYHKLFENFPNAIIITDPDGNIKDCNSAFCKLSRYNKNEIIGKNLKDFHNYPPELLLYIKKSNVLLLKGEIPEYTELEICDKEGKTTWFLVQASLIKLNNEILIQIILQNISAKKAFEKASKNHTEELKKEIEIKTKELIQSEKLASIGLLGAGVAHEINNPIMGIINYAQIVRDELKNYKNIDLNKKPFSFLDGIIRESERISNIVEELLIFSRKDTRQFVMGDINEVISSSINLIFPRIKTSNIIIQKEFQQNLPKISMRIQNIQQVILNILQNSIDALNEKFGEKYQGTSKNIKISTKLVKIQNKKYIKITNWDNGQGIKSKDLIKIFDPFFTTKLQSKIKGTGLGLSISYRIIRDHKGKIEIKSNWKKNTTVTILLPVN